MTDSSPPNRRVEPAVLPPPTIYDPADDQESPAGSSLFATVVLLLVGEADRRWAAETAMALSAGWAKSGRRVVLADLHLESPVLHESVGDEDLEGVVDIFLYGASISRSAHPVAGRGFYLIPAGTYPDDVAEIYQHPRWGKIVEGFRDAGASLVLFAPADGADLRALAPRVDELLVLGRLRDASVLAPLAAAGVPVRTHIVPPEEVSVSTVDETWSAPPPMVEPPLPRPAEPELHLPPPPVRTRSAGRPITYALWLALGVVILAAIGYVLGRVRPDLIPWPSRLAGVEADSTPSMLDPVGAAPAGAVRGGDPLPYSVQVIAFQSLPAALERLAADRAKASSELFISPESIDGMVYYRILAGALPDTAAARRVRESLVADGLVDEDDAAGSFALIESTPLAFRLSEYPDSGAARAAADSLLQRNIPAYPVRVPYSDSTQRWQLYAGAYRDSASADPMRALLVSAGLQPALVTRSGLAQTPVE